MNKLYRWFMQLDKSSDDWGHGTPIIIWAILVGIGHTVYFFENAFTRIKGKLK